MKKLIVSAFVVSAVISQAQTNNSPVLMEIGNKKVSKAEFENIYHKNNKDKATDKKSVTEYMELFTNFKLKVKAAEDMGLDTSATYKSELEGYRKSISQPYLTDKEVNDKLLTEAYDRTKINVRASHLLINCDAAALPKDTLAAYNKVMTLRARILKGEDFGKVAKENSQDPSAKENLGDLGYFSALQMVYPFENAAFNTKVGEVSTPVRTKFGYHLVKVTDKRNDPGTITAAHILVLCKKGASAEDSSKAFAKINEINDRIKKGDKFSELALQYSDDKGSAKNGGELPPFGINRMVPEFETAAFALKNDGDVSAPFKTSYGWHIVKRTSVKPLASYNDMKADLKQRVQRDSRAQKSKESFIAKVKAEYKYSENLKNRDELTKGIDTSFFNNRWKATKTATMNKVVCTLAGKNYTQADYAKYLETRQQRGGKGTAQQVINDNWTPYVEGICTAYETSQLENKYPEYRALLEEYKDGILLFDLTDQKVWSAAIKDTVGLQKYYDANKNNYMWEERYEVIDYKCKDAKIDAQLQKMLAKKKSNDEILKVINKDSQLNLSIDRATYKKGENIHADAAAKSTKKMVTVIENNMIHTYSIDKLLPAGPKALNESRGIITADYQNFLEKEWLKELHAKYPVKVNKEVLDSVR